MSSRPPSPVGPLGRQRRFYLSPELYSELGQALMALRGASIMLSQQQDALRTAQRFITSAEREIDAFLAKVAHE